MEDTLQGKTLDESADKLGISHSTAWCWRHKIMEKMKSFQKDIIEPRQLTKFQKKQVLSLVDRFLEEN